MGLYLLSTLCEPLFFMEMTVLRSSALRCLHIERGVREAAGLVGNVLTSVICVCLSGTRQHHRERHTHSPESDRSWSPLCISRRRRRRDVVGWGRLYRPHTYTYALTCTQRNTHILRIHDGEAGFSYFDSLSPIIKWFLGILSQTKALQWFISIQRRDKWSSGVKILFV